MYGTLSVRLDVRKRFLNLRRLVDFDRVFYASPPSSAIIEERLWQHALEQHQIDTSVALDRQVRLRGHGDIAGLLGTLRDA